MRPGLYFAYGSNLCEEQMRRRCPGSRALYRARLPHYALDFTHYSRRWQGGAADVVPRHDERVFGLVYELGADDWPLLDRFESGYDRLELDVLDDGDRRVQVVSYSVRDKGSYRPTLPYVEQMLRAGRTWSFPQIYLDGLARFLDKED